MSGPHGPHAAGLGSRAVDELYRPFCKEENSVVVRVSLLDQDLPRFEYVLVEIRPQRLSLIRREVAEGNDLVEHAVSKRTSGLVGAKRVLAPEAG